MKALVVDDSKAMRAILKNILVGAGFEVIGACDGQQALEGLQRVGCFDLALVDWNMPNMNGLSFVEAVRAEPSFNDMVLMMVTTETDMERVGWALEAGANEYLMKPFTKDMLLDKLTILGLLDASP